MKTTMCRAVARFLGLAAMGASISLQAQVDKTPVLHLSFDNVSGATVINQGSGGAGMNGTINGSATIVPGGRFGNALQVSGAVPSDASVRVANAVVPLNASANWTVAMWVQTTTPGGAYAYQGDGGWADSHTMFYLNSGGGGGSQAGGVRWGQNWVTGTSAINDGQWHHIVVTCNGSTRNVYVDGVLETPTGDNDWGGNGTGSQFWVGGSGQNGDGAANLNGLVDEVYVFNQTLTLSDIQNLYNNNTLPIVPVSVTVNPTSGYRGQVFTLSATVTPPAGTVTNVTANLSAINLSASANMVLSSGTVYTNTFTVPATAPVGPRSLIATARTSADPFIGSGGATFTVLARPPTNAIIVTELTNVSVIEYTAASFHFGTTNDAPNDAPFPMAYSWYTNGVLVSSNMGPNFTFLTTPADNGMQVQAIARVADTNFSSLTVTSAVVTLTVNSGSMLFNYGLKEELFRTAVVAAPRRQNVKIGNAGRPEVRRVAQADVNPSYGNNHARRYSGYFIAPVSDNYVFFVASDDDCDVFLSTDSNPANKRLIAHEAGWSGTRNWQTPGGGGSTVSQRRSDQWVPDPANPVFPPPYADGIPLTAGNLYYFEAVMNQGTGGDNWAVTYQTTSELAVDPSLPANGTASRMTAANANIAFRTYAGTSLTWVTQPQAVTVYEGQNTNFISLATTDAELQPNYQWYLNNTPIGGNSSTLNLTAIPASYDNAQIKVVANNVASGLSITSSVVTLTVLQAVFEPGWVAERKWMSVFNINGPDAGTLGEPTITGARPGFVVGLDNPSSNVPGLPFNELDSTLQQIGLFVAPSNGNYVFFISSHDGGNLFLSTDSTPANKRLIAQEQGWTSGWNWNTVGGGGSVVSQKRSDQWSPDGGVTVPYAAGIPLVAGQRYYMQVDHTTSRWGNERCGITYRIMESGFVTPPTDGSLPNVGANNSGMNAIRCTYVAFTQQPTNTTAQPMGSATFYADGDTDSLYPIISAFGYTITQPTNKLFYQWYKNGQPIPGATSKTFTLSPVMPSDHGAQIYCAMRALGYANDALQPIWSNSVTATLSVAGEAVFETGVARVEWWTNSTRVAILSGAAGAPNYIYTTPKMIAPDNTGPELNDYANRVSGFFTPPTSGNYVFFLNADDDADLFLSTDASPANKRLIARQNGWAGSTLGWHQTGGGGDSLAMRRSDQFTDPETGLQPYASGIPLVAGQRYYIEGVHNEGGGGDYFAATYMLMGDPEPVNGEDTKISGSALGFYAPRIPWVAITQHPQSPPPVVSGANSVTFSAAGTSAPSIVIGNTARPSTWLNNPTYLQYQWYKNGTPIPGANSSTYTLFPVLPSDHNAQFVCGIRALGYADNALNPIYSNSLPAVLTVIPDTAPPTLEYAASFENTNQVPSHYVVSVTFNKWMNATTLSNAANYTIAGATITNVFVEPNNRTVRLLLNQPPTLPLNITVNGVQDISGNAIAANSTIAINSEKLTFSDVGFPGFDPAWPSHVSVSGVGGYVITAQGSDIWNAYDAFHFAWEWKTNDFDVVVRGVSQGHTDTFAKAGLMVRESLDPYSRNWNVVNHPAPDAVSSVGANDVGLGMREGYSLNSVGWKSGGATPPTYPNAWLRLKRTGQLLQGYASSNAVNWVLLGSYDNTTNVNGVLPAEVLVGICTTAHANDETFGPPPFLFYNTAEYAGYNSSFVPSAPPATLTINQSGGNVVVSWTPAGGTLQVSPAVAGPGVNWQPVGTTNPAIIPIGVGPQFFRVVNP